MPNVTGIEWTDYSSNPIRAINLENGRRGHFCVHASDGCRGCYSERWNVWRGNGLEFIAQNRSKVRFELDERELRAWLRIPAGKRVFVCDMTDLFQEDVPDAMLDRVFAAIALSPATFQVLTKRSARMREYFSAPGVVRRICESLKAWVSEMAPRLNGRDEFDPAVLREERRYQKRFGVGSPAARLTAWTVARGAAAEKFAREEPGREYPSWITWPLPNLWLGVSAEDQKNADRRIPDLLETPAAIRFVSYEPALGPVDFTEWIAHSSAARAEAHYRRTRHQCGPLDYGRGDRLDLVYCADCREAGVPGGYLRAYPTLDWIICGGESGPGARPMHPDWARSLRDQCDSNGIAFFFKQWGEWLPADHCSPAAGHCHFSTPLETFDDGHFSRRVGKKQAGRTLDGRTWDQFPVTPTPERIHA